MPEAEMVMIPSENGRSAEYVTRREADLIFAREARNERKEHEQEELERALTESAGGSADERDEERKIVKPTAPKQEHGTTSTPNRSQATQESKLCASGSERKLFDPRRKRENEEREAKIMEGRILKKRKASDDVDEVFRPDSKKIKTAEKAEEAAQSPSNKRKAAEEVDEAWLPPSKKAKTAHMDGVTLSTDMKKETGLAGNKRKASEVAAEEKPVSKKRKTDEATSREEPPNKKAKTSGGCHPKTDGNGSPLENGSKDARYTTRSVSSKRKRQSEEDEDDTDAHKAKKPRSGVPPKHQLNTTRLARLAAYSRRTSGNTTPTEWAELNKLESEALETLFPFVAHNIAQVEYEAIKTPNSLKGDPETTYSLTARDGNGRIVDFSRLPRAFTTEVSLLKTAFMLRKLEYLSGRSPGSLEASRDTIFFAAADPPSQEVTDLQRTIELWQGMPPNSLSKPNWLHDIDRKPFRLSDAAVEKIRAAMGISVDPELPPVAEAVPVPARATSPAAIGSSISTTTNAAAATNSKVTREMAPGPVVAPVAAPSVASAPPPAPVPSDPGSANHWCPVAVPELIPRRKIPFKVYLADKKKKQGEEADTATLITHQGSTFESRLPPRYVMKQVMRVLAGLDEGF